MCNDPALTYLNGLGYNVIRHPKEKLVPLELIGRQNKTVQQLGRLSTLIIRSDKPLPGITPDLQAAGIEGKSSDKLDFSVGVSILDGFLSAMGGGASVSAQLGQTRSVQFVFSGVLADRADAADAGHFLARELLDSTNPLWRPYLEGQGQLYVVTEVIKSRKFTVSLEQKSGGGLGLDVPALQQVIGAKVGISVQRGSNTALSFEGEKYLVFGFKCFALNIKDGQVSMENAEPSAALSFAQTDGSDDSGAVVLFQDLVELT